MEFLLFEEVESKLGRVTDTNNFMEIGDRRRKDVLQKEVWDRLEWSFREFNYSILLWHIATDIFFYTDQTQASVSENHNNLNPGSKKSDREISLIMSNYMLYLLIMKPSMMSSGPLEKRKVTETYGKARKLFRSRTPDARKKLLFGDPEKHMHSENSALDRLALDDARKLAGHLKSFTEEERWSIIGRVWTEMLCFAAVNCNAYNHAKQLSQGGELLTHVWLMLMQMGLGEKYRIRSKDAFRTLFSSEPVEPEPESESES